MSSTVNGGTIVVANPRAGGGRVGRNWHSLEPALRGVLGPFETVLNPDPDRAHATLRERLDAGVQRVFALGGDGSNRRVVETVVNHGAKDVVVGVLPSGTGGDFARSLRLPRDPVAAAVKLGTGAREVRVDCGRVTSLATGRQHIFLNLASAGMSAEVCRRVDGSSKRFGGTVTFLKATLEANAAWKPRTVRITVDGNVVGEALLGTIAVANGRFAGGGMMFAPRARIDDGTFELTHVPPAALIDTLRMAGPMYGGTIDTFPGIRTWRGSTVELHALGEGGEIGMELDGDPVASVPLRVELLPGALILRVPADALVA